MKRRLFNLAALLSLILCLACAGMWLRSGFVEDHVDKQEVGRLLVFTSRGGALGFERLNETSPRRITVAIPWRWIRIPDSERSPDSERGWWPLPEYQTFRWSTTGTGWWVRLPYWLLCLITGVLPGLWGWKRQKRRMRGRGFPVEARA